MDPHIDSVITDNNGNRPGGFSETGPTETAAAGLQVDVAGDEITLLGSLTCRLAAEYLGRQQPEDWARILGRALEIGVFCLERASGSQDMEFIRRQADRVMQEVATVVGAIPRAISSELLRLIGTEDG